MKKYNRGAIIVIWLLIGWCVLPGWTRSPQEFYKKITREFSISPTGTTAIYNKYGNIKVHTWPNRSVKLDITIVVDAANQRSANRLFERIHVNFLHTADYVKAETVIEPEDGEESYGLIRISFKRQNFKIHYDVWLPAENQLDLKNRYGDALVSQLKGKLMAEIRYGYLQGENLAGDAELSLNHGKAFFNQMRNLSGYINYSELTVERAVEVSLDTRYSEIHISRADQVHLMSKYDKMNLGEVKNLRLQTRYGDLKGRQIGSLFLTAQYADSYLEHISEVLNADLQYGQIRVNTLGRHFSEAKLQAKYTDVKIGVEPGTTFRLDAEGKYADVHTPALLRTIRWENADGKKKLSGYVGDANAPRVISAKLQYGDFVLK
ncbi:MAG: DUF4097 family beta strand repeat-containing protein [Saprospiraceae bacterium]|nr:DUF4097 family beta strand repeat-containing protein [Saprospiraceae bacterium]MDW8483885.1 DUF4097 family beta strand repeat-containing protein [Saprospiraceae bacterium]